MDTVALIPVITIRHSRSLGWAIIVCGDLLLALCLFLFLRRLLGYFERPLGSGALVAVTLAAVAVPTMFRMSWPRLGEADPPFIQRWLRLIAPSVGVLLLACAVSMPGSSPWALAFLWFGIVVGEGTWWVLNLPLRGSPTVRVAPRLSATPCSDAPNTVASASAAPTEYEPQLRGDVTQQITRAQADDGETVYGLLRCDFGPGERSQNLHIAFCPPLDRTPELMAHQVDGPSVSIKPAQVESFGARLELRLISRSVRHERVVVEFEASTPCGQASHEP